MVIIYTSHFHIACTHKNYVANVLFVHGVPASQLTSANIPHRSFPTPDLRFHIYSRYRLDETSESNPQSILITAGKTTKPPGRHRDKGMDVLEADSKCIL